MNSGTKSEDCRIRLPCVLCAPSKTVQERKLGKLLKNEAKHALPSAVADQPPEGVLPKTFCL